MEIQRRKWPGRILSRKCEEGKLISCDDCALIIRSVDIYHERPILLSRQKGKTLNAYRTVVHRNFTISVSAADTHETIKISGQATSTECAILKSLLEFIACTKSRPMISLTAARAFIEIHNGEVPVQLSVGTEKHSGWHLRPAPQPEPQLVLCWSLCCRPREQGRL